MSLPTLVSIRYREIGDCHFFHGDEIEPGLLEGELLDWWLDHKHCMEVPERRSLYLLFAPFSGAKQTEPIPLGELAQYAL